MTTSLLSAQNPASGSRTVAAVMARQPIRAITVDALGTLLELLPPAPRLQAALRERLGRRGLARGGGAGDEGGDRLLPRAASGWGATRPVSRALRRRCAIVLRDALGRAGARARRADRDAAGGDPLRAVPRRGARAAGAAGGGREARGGLELGRLAARAARAHGPVGRCSTARSPRPRSGRRSRTRRSSRARSRSRARGPRRRCTSATTSRPTSAARSAAGLEPVLIDRDGSLDPPPGVRRIASLAELPALCA